MPDGLTGGAEEDVPAGGTHPQAVPAPEYRAAYWDRCAEAAHHDSHGACVW